MVRFNPIDYSIFKAVVWHGERSAIALIQMSVIVLI